MTDTRNDTDGDTELKARIEAELDWTPSVNGTRIGVAVNSGAVTLSGEVETYPERRIAEEAVMRLHGVTAIAEEITVRSNWGSVNDTDIARNASYAISHATNVPSGSVHAAVRDRRITLSGSVGWHYQREAAMASVRFLRGVDDIVNAIEIAPQVSCTTIKQSIGAAFTRNAQIESEHMTVTSSPTGQVTLEGKVATLADRSQAEHLAWSAVGVTAVDNRLKISR